MIKNNMAEGIQIEEVDVKSLKNIPDYLKIIDVSCPRVHAIVSYKKIRYCLSWSSDTIKPKVLVTEKHKLILIGIDLRAVGLNTDTGAIVFSIGLTENFQFFIQTEKGFGIITETSVLLFNGSNCSLSSFNSFPDIILNCKIDHDKLTVECLNNNYVKELK